MGLKFIASAFAVCALVLLTGPLETHAKGIEPAPIAQTADFVKLLEKGNFKALEAALDTIPEPEREHPDVQRFKAVSAYAQGKVSKAVSILEDHLAKTPQDFFAREQLVTYLLDARKPQQYHQARDKLMAAYETYQNGPYFRGQYIIPREYFNIGTVRPELNVPKVRANGVEFYGPASLTGTAGEIRTFFRFILTTTEGRTIGTMLFTANEVENDLARELGSLPEGVTSYDARFYRGNGQSAPHLVTRIQSTDELRFEAARQIVINHIAGFPVDQHLDKWMSLSQALPPQQP